MSPTRKHPSPSRRRAFTLPEALVALAICATLLTAMGTAFTATARALTTNNDFSSATQIARSAIVRMERDIRQGIPAATGLTGNIATGLIIVEGTKTTTYAYNANAKTLTIATGGGAAKTLASNISSCKFIITNGTNADGASCISQVGITLTATVGSNPVTLSGSSTPRRNLPATIN